MEDPVAEEPGEPDEPAVWIRRMDDAQGIGKRRPNGGLVVVIGLTPADGAVKCDHVHCLGPLPGHHEEGPISRTESSLHRIWMSAIPACQSMSSLLPATC